MISTKIFSEIFSLSFIITCAVCLIGFTVGTSMTWTSPVLAKLLNHTDDFFDDAITSNQASWITSCLSLGMAFGNIIYSVITRLIGRRLCFMTVPFVMIIAHVILAFVHKIEFYYVARILCGIGVMGLQVGMNIYMAEILDKSKRGSWLGFIASATVLGFLYSLALGPYVSIQGFNISILIFPTIFLVLFTLVAVETPHYYVMIGKTEMARLSLEKLRSKDDNIDQELKEIEQTIMDTQDTNIFLMLGTKQMKSGFLIAFGLLFFQQLTGIYCIQFYNQEIFEKTGSRLSPEICSIIIGLLQFLSGFVSSVVMERFPRKTLLYFSAAGMALSELPLGVYCYLRQNGTNMDSWSFLPLLTMSVYTLTYNSAFGTLPFIIPSELYPTACKGIAVSTVGFVNSIITFLMSQYFQDAIDAVGIGVLFMVFAAFSALSIPFVRFFVVETRGKSLEEIQEELINSKSYIQK